MSWYDKYGRAWYEEHWRTSEWLGKSITPLPRAVSYQDKEFDGVIAVKLIEHIENSRHFLRDCKRIAKEFMVGNENI